MTVLQIALDRLRPPLLVKKGDALAYNFRGKHPSPKVHVVSTHLSSIILSCSWESALQQLEESALRQRNQIPAFPRKSKKISLVKAPVCNTYVELYYTGWTFVKGDEE